MLSITASAQDFTLSHDTMREETTGKLPPQNWDNDAILMHNFVNNSTNAPLTFKWKIVQKDLPFGWSVYGFCDNSFCRPATHPAIVSNAEQESDPIPVAGNSQLEPRFAVPSDGDNGIGILKARVWTDNTVDTAVYIITKTATGVHQINLNDTRVAVYPNPSDKNISVYSDKSLNVAKISILNIVGREEFSTVASKTREITEISTSSLAKGMYMIHLTDASGKIVTSRKFVKN